MLFRSLLSSTPSLSSLLFSPLLFSSLLSSDFLSHFLLNHLRTLFSFKNSSFFFSLRIFRVKIMVIECLKLCPIFAKTYKSIDRKNEKGKKVELFSVKKNFSIGVRFVKILSILVIFGL